MYIFDHIIHIQTSIKKTIKDSKSKQLNHQNGHSKNSRFNTNVKYTQIITITKISLNTNLDDLKKPIKVPKPKVDGLKKDDVENQKPI